jgi:hypothetical protein
MMGHGDAQIITDEANNSSDYAEGGSDIPDDAHHYAGNAMPSTISNLKSILRPVSNITKSLSVTFDVKNAGCRNCPRYVKDPYRNFSISRVAPSTRPIADYWRPTRCPYMSRIRSLEEAMGYTARSVRSYQAEGCSEYCSRPPQCYCDLPPNRCWCRRATRTLASSCIRGPQIRFWAMFFSHY